MDAFSDTAGKMPNQERLTELARERARESKIGFRAALTEIALERPALADEARREALRGGSTDDEMLPGAFAKRPHAWELYKRARARAAERNIPYSMARRQIEFENPQLAARARAEGGMDIKDIKLLPSGVEMIICHTEFGPTRDPSGLLAFVAGNRARYKKISYRAALSKICSDYPVLAAAARKISSG